MESIFFIPTLFAILLKEAIKLFDLVNLALTMAGILCIIRSIHSPLIQIRLDLD